MRRLLALLTLIVTALTLPATASAESAHGLANRAMQTVATSRSCQAIESPTRSVTDAAPSADVLRPYAIFRSPQPAGVPVAPLTTYGGGRIAAAFERTRVVDGVSVTVAPVLGWRPTVRPRACDARELRVVRRLARASSAAVRRTAVAIVRRNAREHDAVRALPPRELLVLQPGSGPSVTGALALSAQRGLFVDVHEPGTTRTTFLGLVPDGVTRLVARAPDGTTYPATIADNLAVFRLPAPPGRGATVAYDVLDASGATPRRYRKLVSG